VPPQLAKCANLDRAQTSAARKNRRRALWGLCHAIAPAVAPGCDAIGRAGLSIIRLAFAIVYPAGARADKFAHPRLRLTYNKKQV
jgi:hypothetical protein